IDPYRGAAAVAALPRRGNLGLRRQRHAETVTLRTGVGHLLARGQIGVAVVLVARGAEPGAAKRTLAHVPMPPTGPRREGSVSHGVQRLVPWMDSPADGDPIALFVTSPRRPPRTTGERRIRASRGPRCPPPGSPGAD